MGEMLTYVQVAKIIREKIGDIGKDRTILWEAVSTLRAQLPHHLSPSQGNSSSRTCIGWVMAFTSSQ